MSEDTVDLGDRNHQLCRNLSLGSGYMLLGMLRWRISGNSHGSRYCIWDVKFVQYVELS